MHPDVGQGRDDANRCFVCGPENAAGLRVRFRLEDDVCRGEFTPGNDHCGFDGITHGGIIFSLLDDVMANCLYLKGVRCYTAKCEVRFKNPLPVDCRVLLEGRTIKQNRRFAVIEGIALREDTGDRIAECEAIFVIEIGQATEARSNSGNEPPSHIKR